MIKPEILLPGSFNLQDVEAFKTKGNVVDIYAHQTKELFKTIHPELAGDKAACDKFCSEKGQGDEAGAWVYYPWLGKVLHCVGPDDLFALRTNRNKNLISEVEQRKLADAVVGVAGMSVGAGIALAMNYSGISNTIKLADFDTLDTSNLNRLRQGVISVGQPKVELAAQDLYELDPFLNVEQYSEGVTDATIDAFFDGPKLSLVVDEIDDFKMKVHLRARAKQSRTPLIMFTSLGDNILVDVERYDTEPKLQLFNGLIGDVAEEILAKDDISPEDTRRYSVQLVGAEYIPTRALESVLEMGKTLVGRPQLYSTIAVDGGLAAYVARRLILSGDIKSGRHFIKFADLFSVSSDDLAQNTDRQAVLSRLMGK